MKSTYFLASTQENNHSILTRYSYIFPFSSAAIILYASPASDHLKRYFNLQFMTSYPHASHPLVWHICSGGVGKSTTGARLIHFLYLDWYDPASELHAV